MRLLSAPLFLSFFGFSALLGAAPVFSEGEAPLSEASLSEAEAPAPFAPITRPYTLRVHEADPSLREQGRLIREGGETSFILPGPSRFPAPMRPAPLNEALPPKGDPPPRGAMGPGGFFEYASRAGSRRLRLAPQLGAEWRGEGGGRKAGDSLAGHTRAFEGGLLAEGFSGPLSFHLDARMFTELQSGGGFPSYDREFTEIQDESQSGSIAYTSFSRYRSHLALDLGFFRLAAARDALHWGPGLYQNLVFNARSIPFNHLALTARIGPLKVMSVYGQLQGEDDLFHTLETESRSVYAHRYEWAVTENLLLGLSEQTLHSGNEEPFEFVPVVPLFMAKGNGYERLNNGNMALDAAFRFRRLALLYGEFLLDDIQAPTALFGDAWGNKWGFMAGLHLTRAYGGKVVGIVTEYARLEPWVYTHYRPSTSQSMHRGHPLGQQDGPNSESWEGKVYGFLPFGISGRGAGEVRPEWGLSLGGKTLRKGRDLGSHLQDSHPGGTAEKKAFLASARPLRVTLSPAVEGRWKAFSAQGGLHLTRQSGGGDDLSAFLRLFFRP